MSYGDRERVNPPLILRPSTRRPNLVAEPRAYILNDVPEASHLADQQLVPMALGAGGAFRTQRPSQHTLTNIDVIKRFLDVEIKVE